jgi:toxin ParE1/3/4
MFSIRFAPKALSDLEDIKCYVSADLLNPQAAADLMALIFEKIRILGSFPLRGAQLRSDISVLKGYRFLRVRNYLVFYRTEQDCVSIIRVLYARRDYLVLLAPDANMEDSQRS